MSTAFWWYAGAAEAQLLAQITTDGVLSVSLGGLSSSSAATVANNAVLSITLSSLTLSADSQTVSGLSLSVTLAALGIFSVGTEEPVFTGGGEVKNIPIPITERENDYIGISVIYGSKYGEESLTYNRTGPVIFGGGQIVLSSRGVPETYNLTNFTPGNWKFLYKRKE